MADAFGDEFEEVDYDEKDPDVAAPIQNYKPSRAGGVVSRNSFGARASRSQSVPFNTSNSQSFDAYNNISLISRGSSALNNPSLNLNSAPMNGASRIINKAPRRFQNEMDFDDGDLDIDLNKINIFNEVASSSSSSSSNVQPTKEKAKRGRPPKPKPTASRAEQFYIGDIINIDDE